MLGNRFILILLPLICCSVVHSTKICGQTPFDPEYIETASKIKEHFSVFTDRSLYVVDETVKFRADFVLQGLENVLWSTILYVEIVRSSGTSIAKGKFLIENGLSTGGISIPPETLTGNYYLKCYTRWMRNAGPKTFSFVPIKIINPHRSEVVNDPIGKEYESQVFSQVYRKGELVCSTNSSEYHRGAEVTLSMWDEFRTRIDSLNCCLTVVQVGAIDTIQGQMGASLAPYGSVDFGVNYLPDLGLGPTISGTVLRSDQRPAKYAILHFSILGEKPDFMAKAADANGRFAFSTPFRYGEQEFYVSASLKDNASLEVKVDQDFDTSPLRLPGIGFILSEGERELATRMSLNNQFSNAYKSHVKAVSDSSKHINIPFYGTNIQELIIDEYVGLPTLEEVFINVLPRVNVIRKKGKSSLKISSERTDIEVYAPLILMDDIAIFDQEAILSLPSAKIEKIDLINETYFKGEVLFGGMIAIYSKKGDMAGIDLPPGSFFFDYLSFHPEESEVSVSNDPADQIPVSKNTVLWHPDLLLVAGESTELTFTAPLLRGEYVVLMRGVAPNGEVLSATTTFIVE